MRSIISILIISLLASCEKEAAFGTRPLSPGAKGFSISYEDSTFAFYAPNAFTPNGDALNDVFMTQGRGIKSYTIEVFSYHSNTIFRSTDINNRWDGRINGSGDVGQEGVYVYKVTIDDDAGRHHNFTGNVALIK